MQIKYDPIRDKQRRQISKVRLSYIKPNTKPIGTIITPLIKNNGTVILNTKTYTALDLDDIKIKTGLALISCTIASNFIKFLTETDFEEYYKNPYEFPTIEHNSFYTSLKRETNLTSFSRHLFIEDRIIFRNALVNSIKDMCGNLNEIINYYNEVLTPRLEQMKQNFPNQISKIVSMEEEIGDYYHHCLDAYDLIEKFIEIILTIKKYYLTIDKNDKVSLEELKDVKTFDIEGLMKLQFIPKIKKQSTNTTVGV